LFSALKGEEEEKHRFKDVASIDVSSRFSQKVLQEVRRRGGESKETRGPDDRHTEREARGSDGEETNQRRRFWRIRDQPERVQRRERFDGHDARAKDERKGTFCSFITPLERALKEEGDLASSSVFFQSKGGFN
jgi:hypothetical protein|tara:strand:- start:1574 stop:1975 length:402 start_codon:yes stop_codon:yes gene_type:complete